MKTDQVTYKKKTWLGWHIPTPVFSWKTGEPVRPQNPAGSKCNPRHLYSSQTLLNIQNSRNILLMGSSRGKHSRWNSAIQEKSTQKVWWSKSPRIPHWGLWHLCSLAFAHLISREDHLNILFSIDKIIFSNNHVPISNHLLIHPSVLQTKGIISKFKNIQSSGIVHVWINIFINQKKCIPYTLFTCFKFTKSKHKWSYKLTKLKWFQFYFLIFPTTVTSLFHIH